MKYIYSFNSIPDDICVFAGGKGSSLAKLTKAGMPVPEGYIIISRAFTNTTIMPSAAFELDNLIGSLSDRYTYAVRSSALDEDGTTASYAGAFETVTDVRKTDITEAVNTVLRSAFSKRVKRYAENMNIKMSDMAVVIQKYIKADYSGVLFTSDIHSASSEKMQGSYVHGNGEQLVDGSKNAYDFFINAVRYSYTGNPEFKEYARNLFNTAVRIRKLYSVPVDIEWAVSSSKLYILQTRPITTMNRFDPDTYKINGTLDGEYLLSKTNVGEIFMSTVSPATFSVLDSICEEIGAPHFIDNICGQAYCNISVICSLLVSFGISKKKAFSMISDIAGKIPEGTDIPVFHFNKKAFLKNLFGLLFKKPKANHIKMNNKEFIENMSDIADDMIKKIRNINDSRSLYNFWYTDCEEFMSRVMSAIMSALKVQPLLNTHMKLEKLAGSELANKLISGCSGGLESMKPLLMLEDVISGSISREEYIKVCGHRSADELELSKPYPYELPDFPDNLIDTHIRSGVDVHKLKSSCEEQFIQAKEEFKKLFPHKYKWLEKTIVKFSSANAARENVRSKAVKLFCMMREYLLKAGELSVIGDDIFMLYFKETMTLLSGDRSVLVNIPARKESFKKYQQYPDFPNVILGRFEPEKWIKDESRRLDFYSWRGTAPKSTDITGCACSSGSVSGKVHIITDISQADTIKSGEILVTNAANIGWTIIFPKVAAIVTDIGAPLSHAAIVAREFGIPAVFGCSNATTILKTGDTVRVNGSSGTVEILSHSPELL